MSSDDNEIQKKLEVLALADRLGNVAEASRLSGVSRDTIYRHRKLIKQGGIEFSLANPHLGQSKVSRLLKSERNVDIHASGVRNIWLRENMSTTALRLAKLTEARQHWWCDYVKIAWYLYRQYPLVITLVHLNAHQLF
ncbi:helix-turn-helix domain-containing protein [Alteromonas sp. S167]|uniref:helix-turn-helix domain-containing protein n=1 Tax=Alteromonas sp. S167 TaxID=3117402 RepID=UPI002FE41043